MTAAAAPALRSPGRAPGTLASYRDDGLAARALGASAGRRVPLPPALLQLVGVVPLVVLAIVKDDGASNGALAAVLAWLVVLGGLAAGRPHTDRVRWAAPPLLRLAEYGTTLYIGALAGRSSQPAAFALIAVLAFRHYDLVYRFRHQGQSPPAWVGALGLGWDGRLIAGFVLLAAGALPLGYYLLAGIFAAVFVGESIASWRRFGRSQAAGPYDDHDEEEIAE